RPIRMSTIRVPGSAAAKCCAAAPGRPAPASPARPIAISSRPTATTSSPASAHALLSWGRATGVARPGTRSDRFQRRVELGAADDDAAAVADLDAAVALGIDRRQRARLVGGEPQAQQMAALPGLDPVLEAGAVVQEGVIVHQL